MAKIDRKPVATLLGDTASSRGTVC